MIKLLAKTQLGDWIAKIGLAIHREQMKPILKEAFGEDYPEKSGNLNQTKDKNFQEIEDTMVYLFRHSTRLRCELEKLLIRLRR